MRRFQYAEPDENGDPLTITISEREILDVYYGYWSDQMKKAGEEDQICEEHCVEDWCCVNWAWEVFEVTPEIHDKELRRLQEENKQLREDRAEIEKEYAELWQWFNDLGRESNRMRQLLHCIERTPPADLSGHMPPSWWRKIIEDMRDQAREALQRAPV